MAAKKISLQSIRGETIWDIPLLSMPCPGDCGDVLLPVFTNGARVFVHCKSCNALWDVSTEEQREYDASLLWD